MKQKVTKPGGGTQGSDGKPGMIVVKDIHTHPMFVDLLPVSEDLLDKMILDMRAHGFYESEPIVLGTWPGQEEPVLIDGHMRIRAASKTGITDVPFVPVEFESQMAALQHAMNLQAVRSRSTDGIVERLEGCGQRRGPSGLLQAYGKPPALHYRVCHRSQVGAAVLKASGSTFGKDLNEGSLAFNCIYRLCEQYDTLMERGRHKEDGEEKELLTGVSNFVGRSASARRTAQLIGCHYRKVDKIRKIRRDGTPQVQDEVKNDKLTINKAYDLIRKMELGEEDKNSRKLSAGQIKVLRSVLSEETFVALEAMGDDLGALLNAAVERFIGEPREPARIEGLGTETSRLF